MKVSTPEEYAAARKRKQSAARQKRYRENHPDKVDEYNRSRRKVKDDDRTGN